MSKNIKEGSFAEKLLLRRRKAYPERPCECWDCLREAGLTPPLKSRSKYRCQFPKPWHSISGPGVDVPGEINHNLLVKEDKPDPITVLPSEGSLAKRAL